MSSVNSEEVKEFNSEDFDIETHKTKMIEWLNVMRKVCRLVGARFTIVPSVWFWRNRMNAIAVMSKMTVTLSQEMGHSNEIIGPTIAAWRSVSPMQTKLVRVITHLLVTQRRSITISMIEVENAQHGNGASTDTVREAVNHGIALKLLEKRGRGPKTSYKATKLLIDEMAFRCFARIMSDEFQAAARFAVTFNTLHGETMKTAIAERQGAVVSSDHQSYLERLFWGDDGRGDEE
tara:strand:+ start:309 stop:1010 length:702 start_codon:yes stop_codon:yes gene_type:complete